MRIEDQPVTRRRLLALGAAGAVTATVPTVAINHIAKGAIADPDAPVDGPALEPEIVTVTDTSVVAWWRTETPQDTSLTVVALDGPKKGTRETLSLSAKVTVHCAKITGLTPGTRYRYEMRSNRELVSYQASAEADPGEFQTLVKPKGRLLARIAVLNDLHVGERCSGIISGDPENSIPDCYTVPDYAYKMVDASLTEVSKVRADLLIANGDLTDRGRNEEVKRAMDRLRKTKIELMVTRGNHDRRLAGECAADGDCLRAQAFPNQAEGDPVLRSVKRIGGQVAVVGLDSCHPDSGRGRLDLGDQPAWLEQTLTKLKSEGRVVIVAFHHPILEKTEPVRISNGVVEGQAEILEILGRHDHVKLVINGHTHRNNVSFDPVIGERLPFLENGAVKEYPAGYAVLDVYETGIMRTFHRPDSEFSRYWVNISAKQIGGAHPSLTRGSLGSRAFVTSYSKKGLATADSATKGDTGLAAKARRQIGINRLLKNGLPVEIVGYPGAQATARLIVRFSKNGASQTVQIGATRRKGSGKLVLRVGRKHRRRISRLKKGRRAILQVTSAGRVYEQQVNLTRPKKRSS